MTENSMALVELIEKHGDGDLPRELGPQPVVAQRVYPDAFRQRRLRRYRDRG